MRIFTTNTYRHKYIIKKAIHDLKILKKIIYENRITRFTHSCIIIMQIYESALEKKISCHALTFNEYTYLLLYIDNYRPNIYHEKLIKLMMTKLIIIVNNIINVEDEIIMNNRISKIFGCQTNNQLKKK